MNLFGLGPGELFLVMLLALIVFGPSKLPEIGANLGKAINEFRKASSQLTEEFTRELQVSAPREKSYGPSMPAKQHSPASEGPREQKGEPSSFAAAAAVTQEAEATAQEPLSVVVDVPSPQAAEASAARRVRVRARKRVAKARVSERSPEVSAEVADPSERGGS